MDVIVFGTIKFFGYSAFAVYLNHYYSRPIHPVIVGLGRAIVGIIFGLTYRWVWNNFSPFLIQGSPLPLSFSELSLYYGGLLPIRFFEWWLVISFLYKPDLIKKGKGWNILLATFVSFLLDIPAVVIGVFFLGVSPC